MGIQYSQTGKRNRKDITELSNFNHLILSTWNINILVELREVSFAKSEISLLFPLNVLYIGEFKYKKN